MIPHPAHPSEVTGPAGVRLYLLPNPVDVHIQSAGIPYKVCVPYLVHQKAAGEHLSGMSQKDLQKAELFGGKVVAITAAVYLVSIQM